MNKIKGFIIKHKKLSIVALLAIILVGSYSVYSKTKNKYPILESSQVSNVLRKDFMESTSESGVVKSENESFIYSDKQLPIKEINVKVGDRVNEGDIIAILDDSTIREQIAKTKALISATNKSAGAQIESASERLEYALKNQREGTNSMVSSANSAAIQSYDAWKSAAKVYEDYKKSIENGYNEQLLAQDQTSSSLSSAKEQADLNLNQAMRKADEFNRSSTKNKAIYDEKVRELNSLRRELENNSNAPTNIDPVAEERVKFAKEELAKIDNEIVKTKSEIQSNDTSEETKKFLRDKLGILESQRKNADNTLKSAIDSLKNSQPNTNASDISARISKLEAEVENYKALIDQDDAQYLQIQSEIEQASLANKTASKNLNNDSSQKSQSKKSMNDTLKTYKKNMDDAKKNYEAAVKNLEVALASQKSEIDDLKLNIKSAKASSDTSVNGVELKFLYDELEKTIIKAPISGVITEDNLVLGQIPSNYLAKIETIDRIVVDSQIKEFDLNRVKPGMDVEIVSEALGSKKILHGKLESIYPTAKKKIEGASTEVLYATKIVVDEKDAKELKPDMTVRVRYVIDKKDNVLVIPSNSIYEKGAKKFVLVADGKNPATLKEVEITVRAENDFESVIVSDNLKESNVIINNPEEHSAGEEVKIMDKEGSQSEQK